MEAVHFTHIHQISFLSSFLDFCKIPKNQGSRLCIIIGLLTDKQTQIDRQTNKPHKNITSWVLAEVLIKETLKGKREEEIVHLQQWHFNRLCALGFLCGGGIKNTRWYHCGMEHFFLPPPLSNTPACTAANSRAGRLGLSLGVKAYVRTNTLHTYLHPHTHISTHT